MPKVRWCVPVPPPNLAKDLICRHMKAKKISSAELGRRVHMEPESVRRKKMKGTWTVAEFRDWCNALGIDDPEEVGKAILNRT